MKRWVIHVASIGILCFGAAYCAEKVTVKLPTGETLPCEIFKINKDGVLLRPDGKPQQTVAFDRLRPADVLLCWTLVRPSADANARMDMGSYFFNNKLLAQAEEELIAAVALDSNLKSRAEKMLAAINILKEVAVGKDPKKKDPASSMEPDKPKPGRQVAVANPDGSLTVMSAEDFENRFRKKDTAARTPEQMKAFLDKRLVELKEISGNWRMIETAHFYCFSNVPEKKLKVLSQWNENLYTRLCEVLKHKDGEKLWHNKMPIYYFERFGQFQNFAVQIDHAPGAANSGGYFYSEGREVHICIPFMSERYPGAQADRVARNTLHHECTHAFLQVSGEDVKLSRWLHEGLAQFIEFWYDRENNTDMRENNPERKERVAMLKSMVAQNYLPAWSAMANRPASGGDVEGYALAWAKLEFLYRNFDKQCLPKMIRLIKTGKTEEEAMNLAFGFPAEKLEAGYLIWLKAQAKNGFKFE